MTDPCAPEADAEPAPGAGAGRLLLYYAARGPLGGSFTCSRCAQQASHADLIEHVRECPYVASCAVSFKA